MSVQWLTKAFAAPQEVDGARRLVLLAIADSANDEGYAYVRRKVIAEKTGIRKLDTVTSAVTWLQDRGWLARKVNGWAGMEGQIPVGKRPNLYRMTGPPEAVTEGSPRDGDGASPSGGDGGSPPDGEENRLLEPSTDPASTSKPAASTKQHPDAERLTKVLLRSYAHHAELESPPKVTAKAVRDMDLLLRRGPVDQEPVPLDPKHVERVVLGVFDLLAARRGDFCWADQIRSPGALRKHWARLRVDLNKAAKGSTGGRAPAVSDEERRRAIELGRAMNERKAAGQ